MKRTWAALAIITLALLSVPTAQAGTTILLTEPTHREFNGVFIDDELANSLGVTGRLGNLVFNPPSGMRSWWIDPALIEEITAMANGYTLISGTAGVRQLIAKSWLTQLNLVSKSDNVTALAYGNPSSYWISRLASHEANYVLTISQQRLSKLLDRTVGAAFSYHSHSQFVISNSDILSLKSDSTYFAQTSSYVDPATIDTFRLALIKILNPTLTLDRREFLIRDLTSVAYAQIHLVHLSSGKFTVTATHQNLPITVTNGFPTNIKINLYVFPTNLKIQVGNLQPILIPANSKVQVMVPITALTSGTSGLSVELTTSHGDLVGDQILYPLKISVISPVATWFTTGAAILLFLAATIQSVRRIRRRKHE